MKNLFLLVLFVLTACAGPVQSDSQDQTAGVNFGNPQDRTAGVDFGNPSRQTERKLK